LKNKPKPNNIAIFDIEMQWIQPNEIHGQNILFSALNWGYGHVMRSIVLLKQLRRQDNQIFVVATAEQIQLFKSEAIDTVFIQSNGYPFEFSGKGNFAFDLLSNSARLRSHYRQEQQFVEKLCLELDIHWVIADQSLGFFSRKVTSVIITHQVHLPLKWWQKLGQKIYDKQLDNFNHIWIPDQSPPNNLAGRLSESNRKNVSYIGWLSRFIEIPKVDKQYDVGVLVTGPQPYAQQFFEEMCKRFENSQEKVFILYNGTDLSAHKNIKIFQHLPTAEMADLLCSAELLITRSGYSTLMDLNALGIKNVELHATPGQAEQAYLLERCLTLSQI
jgi:UDP:flavonoid glycosyltransferase YjiC (YdhE family)